MVCPCSNYGILIAFLVGFAAIYLGASVRCCSTLPCAPVLTLSRPQELITEAKSKGEVKLYPRSRIPHDDSTMTASAGDVESQDSGRTVQARDEDDENAKDVHLQRQTAIFHWRDLCYDIPVKGGTRRLLEHVDGWVKVRFSHVLSLNGTT